jgi:tripartite-type tricarboxylate transporter receptor subunit TctC
VPTVAEVGLPANLTGAVFFGVMAPGGTPEPIISRLNAAFTEVLTDPTTAKKLVDLGFVLVGGSAADYGKRLAAETEKWRKVIQEAKIAPPA